MRIRLEASDRLPFWLIGNPAQPERDVTDGVAACSQVLNDNLQMTRNQQSVTGAEWEVREVIDRGNAGVTYEATVHHIFNDEFERMEFITSISPLDKDDEIHRWQGDVWMRTVGADNIFRDDLLPDAAVSLSGTQLDGKVGLRLTYRIQAGGYDKSATREGVEMISLQADGISLSVPVFDIFATSVGGDPVNPVDGGHVWPASSVETTAPWWQLEIEVIAIQSGVEVPYVAQFAFGGYFGSGWVNLGALPITDHFSAIATALDPDWVTAEIVTISGRQALRLTYAAETEGEGLLAELPRLRVELRYRGLLPTGATAYEVTQDREPVPANDVTLMDSRGVVLIADRLTN